MQRRGLHVKLILAYAKDIIRGIIELDIRGEGNSDFFFFFLGGGGGEKGRAGAE